MIRFFNFYTAELIQLNLFDSFNELIKQSYSFPNKLLSKFCSWHFYKWPQQATLRLICLHHPASSLQNPIVCGAGALLFSAHGQSWHDKCVYKLKTARNNRHPVLKTAHGEVASPPPPHPFFTNQEGVHLPQTIRPKISQRTPVST